MVVLLDGGGSGSGGSGSGSGGGGTNVQTGLLCRWVPLGPHWDHSTLTRPFA